MTLPSVTNSEARAQTTLVVPNASGGEPSAGRFDIFLVAVASAALSVVSLLYYFRRGDLLLYGDPVAHINIARRIFDSLTPGLNQLGTVWLPLPHLLIAPFVASDRLWRSGVGAAIPSMIAFVLAAAGIYRLTREALDSDVWRVRRSGNSWSRAGGLLAAAIFACNPNLVYLQTTAMNEVVYLALFLWSLVWLQRFAGGCGREAGQLQSDHDSDKKPRKALIVCGILLCAAGLTRYEGWAVAGLCIFAVLIILIAQRRLRTHLAALLMFGVLAAAAPIFWHSYNRAVYGNALEFANGQYSARAIEQRSIAAGGSRNPAHSDPMLAGIYLLQATLGDLGEARIARSFIFALAIAGTLLALARRRWLLLLLWAPLPFYVYSIAYGGVPIFVPDLW